MSKWLHKFVSGVSWVIIIARWTPTHCCDRHHYCITANIKALMDINISPDNRNNNKSTQKTHKKYKNKVKIKKINRNITNALKSLTRAKQKLEEKNMVWTKSKKNKIKQQQLQKAIWRCNRAIVQPKRRCKWFCNVASYLLILFRRSAIIIHCIVVFAIISLVFYFVHIVASFHLPQRMRRVAERGVASLMVVVVVVIAVTGYRLLKGSPLRVGLLNWPWCNFMYNFYWVRAVKLCTCIRVHIYVILVCLWK